MHPAAMVAALSNPVTLAERRLSWLDGRQRVLAENVANADTPRYRARDVAPFARLLAAESPLADTPVATVSITRAARRCVL
jgi:flagellar basal-body rod protein FlgB